MKTIKYLLSILMFLFLFSCDNPSKNASGEDITIGEEKIVVIERKKIGAYRVTLVEVDGVLFFGDSEDGTWVKVHDCK